LQDNHPVAFHSSRKLNDAQTRCATTERELLSIAETLKEFKMIQSGHKTVTWTAYKNLIHDDLKSERVFPWCLLMEEHGPDVRCVKGPENIVADALSCLPSREELADCFAKDIEEN
jgi:hypothetical protein